GARRGVRSCHESRDDHREGRGADRAPAPHQARRGGKDPRRGGTGSDVSDGRALAREFLEQQRLLGGDPIILTDGPTPGSRPGKSETGLGHKGSDLPPAGLSYDPPGGDLFSADPLHQAASLDAVATLVAACTKSRLREEVFICNVVKCRPPENRVPQYDEIAACVPYLFRQIDVLKPQVILAMGGTAAQTLLNTKQSLGALRNQIHRFRGVPVIVTYH